MLKKTIYRLLRHRHFWREVGFDELSELYVSMIFRGLSISLTGLFIPIYLYQLHFNVTEIFMVVAWYFTFRAAFVDLLCAYTIARLGPKHTMLIGQGLLIASTALFLTLPEISWPIWLLGGIWGSSASFFYIPFHVDFSKVKHTDHGGKELGFINIMDRTGSALGPLIGGIVATIFGAQYIFLFSVVLLMLGTWPLFRTAEPVKLGQKLDFKSLKIEGHRRDFISVMGLGVENTLTMFMWPLFLGVFVLASGTVYAQLGAIASISFVVAIFAFEKIGKLIDQKHGRELLRASAMGNAALHLARPFVSTLPFAFGVNLANETLTPGYRMPYFKGEYDAADDLPGYRIVYISSMEMISSVAKATAWWLLVIFSLILSARSVMTLGFIIAAGASLVIMTERFKALSPKFIMRKA